ncbi:MAG: phage Gp37/Gp68 family protein [Nitrospinota bacterium]|nr:phage Gp37/Gp68 family protein [Nitrospinota bacterium]
MTTQTKIEWTEATWNPVTGCAKISPGCKHCYAERMAHRLCAMGQPNYAAGFDVAIHQHMLEAPLKIKRPTSIFVNSMSDMFHEKVPQDFISSVFGVMRSTPRHRFQVLTKRAGRLAKMAGRLPWPENVWMGVSVENADYTRRIDQLRNTGAKVKFLSLEPLLGPMPKLDLSNIDWVIVGGESGPGARPMKSEWALDIRDQCLDAGVAFFFKQWGGWNKKKAGRTLDGRTWDQTPLS